MSSRVRRGLHRPCRTANPSRRPTSPRSTSSSRSRGAARASCSRARSASPPCFLGTVRPDGRPHAAAVGGAFHDGDLYFQCGPDTRKARNVAANPACTDLRQPRGDRPGLRGRRRARHRRRDRRGRRRGLPRGRLARPGGGETFTAPYNAPSAGPAPWHLFRVTVPHRLRRRHRRAPRRHTLAFLTSRRWDGSRVGRQWPTPPNVPPPPPSARSASWPSPPPTATPGTRCARPGGRRSPTPSSAGRSARSPAAWRRWASASATRSGSSAGPCRSGRWPTSARSAPGRRSCPSTTRTRPRSASTCSRTRA